MGITSNRWFQLVTLLAPAILANVKGGEKIAPLIPVIVSGIEEAQQIKGASGADKKAHVLALAEAAARALTATGKFHLDPAEVQTVTGLGIDTTIGVINLVHQKV